MGKYVDHNGTKIYYQERGQGEPLVLLMGFGADGNTWEKHVSVYEKHFRCILIDNRGVGLSEMISSIQSKKTNKCNGNLSLHVLNIIEAIHLSAKRNKPQKIIIKCEKPKLFTTKEINTITK